jgi:hypothetical protein
MTFNLTSIGATMATISNGVYILSLGGIVTTDVSGNIVGWDFIEDELLPDLSIVRLDSFRDGAFGGDAAHKFLLDETSRDAFNFVSGNLEFRTSERSRPRCDTYLDLSGAGYAARF